MNWVFHLDNFGCTFGGIRYETRCWEVLKFHTFKWVKPFVIINGVQGISDNPLNKLHAQIGPYHQGTHVRGLVRPPSRFRIALSKISAKRKETLLTWEGSLFATPVEARNKLNITDLLPSSGKICPYSDRQVFGLLRLGQRKGDGQNTILVPRVDIFRVYVFRQPNRSLE